MDYLAALNNPIVFITIAGMAIAIGSTLILMKPKQLTIGFERSKVGFVKIHAGRLIKKKGDSDYTFKLPDGRNLVIPKEKMQDAEILEVPKSFKLKKGISRLFPIENGQITHFNGSLAEQTNPLLDSESVSAVVQRGSIRILARLSGALSGGYTMILLAGMAAFAVAWVVYPMFNHPAPVIECFKVLANGTRVQQGLC